ncbi:hypothetical protein HDU96_007227 [Phlyctochytrium bullatum]|nr:hypothetical protein HDU96_007227 [Phlyctochytrium bullatum]
MANQQTLQLVGLNLTASSPTPQVFVIVVDTSPAAAASNTIYHLRQKIAAKLQVPEPDLNLFRVDDPSLQVFDPRLQPSALRDALRTLKREQRDRDLLWGRRRTVVSKLQGGQGIRFADLEDNDDTDADDPDAPILPYDLTRLLACTWVVDLFVPASQFFAADNAPADPSNPIGNLRILVTVGRKHLPANTVGRGAITRKRIAALDAGGAFAERKDSIVRQPPVIRTPPPRGAASKSAMLASPTSMSPTAAYPVASTTPATDAPKPASVLPNGRPRPVPPPRRPPTEGGSWSSSSFSLNSDTPTPTTPTSVNAPPPAPTPAPRPPSPPPLRRTTTLDPPRAPSHRPRRPSQDLLSLPAPPTPTTRHLHLPFLVLGQDPAAAAHILVIEESASMPSLLMRLADRLHHPHHLAHQLLLFVASAADITARPNRPVAATGTPVPGSLVVEPGLDLFEPMLRPENLAKGMAGVAPGMAFVDGRLLHRPVRSPPPQRRQLLPFAPPSHRRIKSMLGPRGPPAPRNPQPQAGPAAMPNITDTVQRLFPTVAWIPPHLVGDAAIPVTAFFPRPPKPRRSAGKPASEPMEMVRKASWAPTRLRLLVVVDPARGPDIRVTRAGSLDRNPQLLRLPAPPPSASGDSRRWSAQPTPTPTPVPLHDDGSERGSRDGDWRGTPSATGSAVSGQGGPGGQTPPMQPQGAQQRWSGSQWSQQGHSVVAPNAYTPPPGMHPGMLQAQNGSITGPGGPSGYTPPPPASATGSVVSGGAPGGTTPVLQPQGPEQRWSGSQWGQQGIGVGGPNGYTPPPAMQGSGGPNGYTPPPGMQQQIGMGGPSGYAPQPVQGPGGPNGYTPPPAMAMQGPGGPNGYTPPPGIQQQAVMGGPSGYTSPSVQGPGGPNGYTPPPAMQGPGGPSGYTPPPGMQQQLGMVEPIGYAPQGPGGPSGQPPLPAVHLHGAAPPPVPPHDAPLPRALPTDLPPTYPQTAIWQPPPPQNGLPRPGAPSLLAHTPTLPRGAPTTTTTLSSMVGDPVDRTWSFGSRETMKFNAIYSPELHGWAPANGAGGAAPVPVPGGGGSFYGIAEGFGSAGGGVGGVRGGQPMQEQAGSFFPTAAGFGGEQKQRGG